MFNGHLDIDPLAYGWKRDPWTPAAEGDRLYGAGSYNMKGGDAAMIMAAEAVRQSGVRLPGDLLIACVAGELQGGVGTVHLLRRGLRTDMAVVPEPVGADNVVTTHAGATLMAVSTIGRSVHTSRTEEALDAIEMMLKAIPAIKGARFRHPPRPELPGLPRLSVGCIIGGRGRTHDLKGPNYTCDFCTVLIDVRLVPGQTLQSVEEDVRAALEAVRRGDPGFQYEIERPPAPCYRVSRIPRRVFDVPGDAHIVQSVIRHYQEVTGRPPRAVGTVLPIPYGGTDACHLGQAGIPSVVYGPSGLEGTPEETDNCVFISEMVRATQVLALTALDVCSLPAA